MDHGRLNAILIPIFVIVSTSFIIIPADAAKTGSYNFCSVFPAFPECTGWRTEAVDDNHWFCDYVHLDGLCKNPPDPQKQIPLRGHDHCCRYIGDEIKSSTPITNNTSKETELPKETKESIEPLIIWTDKDHYNYRDKIIVYGKFDFTNPTVIENADETNFDQTGKKSITSAIDIKLNGNRVLKEIPITPTGWFSAFFFHDNIYRFSTQDNLLEVEYIISSDVIPPGGPKTHATYHFTTGNIAKEDKTFDLWIDKTELPNKIIYGLNVENNERLIKLDRLDLVKTRITTPEGYVMPIKSIFSIHDISAEYDGFKEYGYGEYKIQVTYGNNVAEKFFKYENPEGRTTS
ncbi:hypothetical protein [Nitrosopumilus sp.]|uniref:hypothetical protein n=1 Tax=Nitrosopumilus sp. TaxID=2024843 RepID=UPI003B5C7F55